MSSARNSTTFEDVFEDAKFVEAYKVTQLITGQFARDLINRTGLLDAIRADPSRVKWFDDACGPGVVANELVVMEPKAIEVDEYLATDLSPTMVQAAEMTMKSQGWQNGKTLIQDATDLKDLPSAHFSCSTSNFCFFGLPDGVKAVSDPELLRVTQPGGRVGFTSWNPPMDWLTIAEEACRRIGVPMKGLQALYAPGHEWDNPEWIVATSRYQMLKIAPKRDPKSFEVECELIRHELAEGYSVQAFVDGLLNFFPIIANVSGWGDRFAELKPKLEKEMIDVMTEGINKNQPLGGSAWVVTLTVP